MFGRWRSGFIACGLVLAIFVTQASSALAQGVSMTDVSGEEVVGADSVATFNARCPAATHPVAGELSALDATGDGQLVLAASYPIGQHRWRIAVLNLSAAPHGAYTAVECLRGKLRFAYPQRSVVTGPEQARGADVTCPASAPVPIGGSFKLESGTPAGSAVVNWMMEGLSKRGVTRQESVGMRNLTAGPVGVVVGAVCANLPIQIASDETTVRPGQVGGFFMRCPGKELAVGGGFFGTDSRTFGEITLSDFFAANARGWAIAARNLGHDPAPFVAAVVCLR
jgi:hypothetical protein